ncbi:MAG: site-2 protease family protein [Candidatus Bathyarchaeia archaeon]
MNETEKQTNQTEFERLKEIVCEHFQIEEALIEHNIPTFYLKQPQETKQAFLKLLKKLGQTNLMAFLRRSDGRVVLRIFPKQPSKPSSVLVNWLLLFATVGTTFAAGYLQSAGFTDPLIGGAAFTVAVMAVLGMHEMGHKLTADVEGVEATPPYFIPGPPPLGTFGAVIMQKSLPLNKDSLFDIGASGPLFGFLVAIVATIIGLPYSSYNWVSEGTPTLPAPLFFRLFAEFLLPPAPTNGYKPGYMLVVMLHPVAFAGWIGFFVTMLNLLPAAMLDGGHVARSLFSERIRSILTMLSIIFLVFVSWPMAIFVLFMSMFRHPGPLDDVSDLSRSRKIFLGVLVVIFILSSPLYDLFYSLVNFLRWLFGA